MIPVRVEKLIQILVSQLNIKNVAGNKKSRDRSNQGALQTNYSAGGLIAPFCTHTARQV